MQDRIVEYFTALWELTAEMAPWLILGFLFAGILKVWFPQKQIDRYLGKKSFRSTLNASLLGIPMPLCSCGVIPTGISFFRNGASRGATNSFLISTPQTGVDSIMATYSLMGWPFAVIRPVIAFFTGILGGILTNITEKKATDTAPLFKIAPENHDNPNCSEESCCCEASASPPKSKLYQLLHYGFVEMLQDIGKYLIVGLMLAALISVVLPVGFFEKYTSGGMVEMLIVLASSVPLYICATGSIPIAAVLLLKGVSPGAAIVFLMAGPATNIATITVIGKTMGRKSLIAYLVSIVGGALLFGTLVNAFIPQEWLMRHILFDAGHTHSALPEWLTTGSAVVIIALTAFAMYLKYRTRNNTIQESSSTQTFRVEGMTCNHCKANVEKNIAQLDGVGHIEINLTKGAITVTGTVDPEKIKAVIISLGYKVVE